MRHQRAIAEKGREKEQNIVNCTLKITRNETNNYIGISCIINSIRRKQTTNSIENNHKTVLFFFRFISCCSHIVHRSVMHTQPQMQWTCACDTQCTISAHTSQPVVLQKFNSFLLFHVFYFFFLFRFRRNARLLHVFDGNKFVLSLFFFRSSTHAPSSTQSTNCVPEYFARFTQSFSVVYFQCGNRMIFLYEKQQKRTIFFPYELDAINCMISQRPDISSRTHSAHFFFFFVRVNSLPDFRFSFQFNHFHIVGLFCDSSFVRPRISLCLPINRL